MGKGVDKTHCGVNQGRHNNQKNQSSEYRFVRRYHTPFYFAGRYAVKLPPVTKIHHLFPHDPCCCSGWAGFQKNYPKNGIIG